MFGQVVFALLSRDLGSSRPILLFRSVFTPMIVDPPRSARVLHVRIPISLSLSRVYSVATAILCAMPRIVRIRKSRREKRESMFAERDVNLHGASRLSLRGVLA